MSDDLKLYGTRDHFMQGQHYIKHVMAMTEEGLHRKSDIAAELAHRDIQIEALRAAVASTLADLRVARAAQQAAQPVAPVLLQGGMSSEELRAAWDKKLHCEPKGQELSAFAVGIEVGFAHAQDLERQDWSRVHHVLKKHGVHPGRTDDHLAEVIDRALAQQAAQPVAPVPMPGGIRLTVVERCELIDWRDKCVDDAVSRTLAAVQPVAQEPRVCWLVEEFSDSGNSTGRYMQDQNGLTITTDVQKARQFRGSRTATFRATDMREKWGTAWRPVSHVFWVAQPQPAAEARESLGWSAADESSFKEQR